MPSPEERASKRLKEADYTPLDKEEAKKRLMIAEIVDALNKSPEDKVAQILDQIKVKSEEDDTLHDLDPEKTKFYKDEEVSD